MSLANIESHFNRLKEIKLKGPWNFRRGGRSPLWNKRFLKKLAKIRGHERDVMALRAFVECLTTDADPKVSITKAAKILKLTKHDVYALIKLNVLRDRSDGNTHWVSLVDIVDLVGFFPTK